MNRSALLAVIVILSAGGAAIWLQSDGDSAGPGALPMASGISSASTIIQQTKAEKQKEFIDSQAEIQKPVISETGPWPVAKVDEQVYHFGRMEVGGRNGRHEFTIRNEGEADLELRAGSATCQCTEFSVEKNHLAPGEETHVVVVWQLKSRNSMFRHGGPIYTNDPKNPTIDFNVEGVVDAPFEILPEGVWNVGNVYLDKPARMQVQLGSRVHESFQIETLEASSDFVTFRTRPMTEEMKARDNWAGGHVIDVQVSNDIPPGPFECSVKMKIDVRDEVREFTVRARKQGNIRFLPTPGTLFDPAAMVLKLGTFTATAGNSRKLMLIVSQEGLSEPLKITQQKNEPAYLNATLEPMDGPAGNSQRYLLTVHYPPGRPRASYNPENPARIFLETNHPRGEAISFEVYLAAN